MLSDAERNAWVTYLTTGEIAENVLVFEPGEHGRLWEFFAASDRIIHKRQFLKRMVAAFPHVVDMEKRGRSLPSDTREILQKWVKRRLVDSQMLMPENLAWVRWIILNDISSVNGAANEKLAKSFVLKRLSGGRFILSNEGIDYLSHLISNIALDERASSEQVREPTVGPDLDEENAINEMLRKDFLRIVGRFKHTQRFPRHPVDAYARMDEEGFDLASRPRPKLVSEETRVKMLDKNLVPPPDDVIEDIKDEIAAKRKRLRPDEMLEENDKDLRKIEAQIRKHPYLGQAIPMQRPDFVRLNRADPDYLKVR